MKRALCLLIAGFVLIAGCAGSSGPPVATPTPVPWIDKCPDPVYRMNRGADFPDEVPTTFYESYPNLGESWNDRARGIRVFKGAQVRIYQDEYVLGSLEENFEDISATVEDFYVELYERNGRYDGATNGVSAVMIRKCPNPSISPSPS